MTSKTGLSNVFLRAWNFAPVLIYPFRDHASKPQPHISKPDPPSENTFRCQSLASGITSRSRSFASKITSQSLASQITSRSPASEITSRARVPAFTSRSKSVASEITSRGMPRILEPPPYLKAPLPRSCLEATGPRLFLIHVAVGAQFQEL